MNRCDVNSHSSRDCLLWSQTGLMQQFSENLCEAGLLEGSAEGLRLSSRLNLHSHQEQLVKAVLIAGLYPHLIQVL